MTFQMTSLQLMDVWCKLEAYAWMVSRRYSRRREDREEFVGDALVRLGRCPSGCSREYYLREIEKGVRSAYMRKYRARWKSGEAEITLSFIETMDRETYESWRHGYYSR